MTLDEYRAWAEPRCKVVPHLADDRPCLIWQGATINKGRHPRAVMKRGFPPVAVRREAWAILHPTKPLGKDSANPGCECDLCIEPTHFRRVTASEARSVPKSMAGRLRMQKAARAKRSKVQDPAAIVPLVLADSRPAHKVATELGLGKDVIYDMRRGKWNNALPGNPFAGLGARANDERKAA
jgi:hypothetical protein